MRSPWNTLLEQCRTRSLPMASVASVSVGDHAEAGSTPPPPRPWPRPSTPPRSSRSLLPLGCRRACRRVTPRSPARAPGARASHRPQLMSGRGRGVQEASASSECRGRCSPRGEDSGRLRSASTNLSANLARNHCRDRLAPTTTPEVRHRLFTLCLAPFGHLSLLHLEHFIAEPYVNCLPQHDSLSPMSSHTSQLIRPHSARDRPHSARIRQTSTKVSAALRIARV